MSAKRARLPLVKTPQPPVPLGKGDARLCAYLKAVLIDGLEPEFTPEMGPALAGMVLGVMQDNLRLKLGVTPDQARAASLGWLLGAAAQVEDNETGDR